MVSLYSTPWKKGLKRAIQGRTSVFILADSNLPEEYLKEVVNQCEGDVPIHSFRLEGGEKIKTLKVARIANIEASVFEALEDGIREFMNGRRWTNDNFNFEERIECTMHALEEGVEEDTHDDLLSWR